MTPLPPEPAPAPTPPSTFTPVTVIAYVAALAVFVIGVLVTAGVPVPAHLSAEVQTWAGAAEQIVGALVAAGVYFGKQSLIKTALQQGVEPHVANRL